MTETLKPCPCCGGEAYGRITDYRSNANQTMVAMEIELGCKPCGLLMRGSVAVRFENHQLVMQDAGWADMVRRWNRRA